MAAADAAKKAILAPTLDYRKRRAAEEDAKRQEELKRQREAQEAARKAAEEARAAGASGAPAPAPAPVQLAPKKPTGLRTVRVCQITDLQAIAAQIAAMDNPPAEFVDACRTIARRMLESGAAVNGAEIVTEQRAA